MKKLAQAFVLFGVMSLVAGAAFAGTNKASKRSPRGGGSNIVLVDPHNGNGGWNGPVIVDGYADLLGYCPDYDHRQFMEAKSFAYSPSGLNYSSDESVRWALDYNASHACGTIGEYANRYRALYQYGYSPRYLNMNSDEARRFALERVEFTRAEVVQRWSSLFVVVNQLMYSPSYLNNNSSESVRASREWVERGYCGDEYLVRDIMDAYAREYRFAYSPSGLNLNSSEAKAYALDRVRYMTRCGDLLY